MKKPLVWLTVFLCLGIICAEFIHFPPLLLALINLGLLIFAWHAFNKQRACEIYFLTLAFCFGSILLISRDYLPRRHVSRLINSDHGDSFTVKGCLLDEPILKGPRCHFALEAQAIKIKKRSYKCCGRVLVRATRFEGLTYGEEIVFRGRLVRLSGYLLRQNRQYKSYLANQGIYSVFSVEEPGDLLRLNRNKGFGLKRLALNLKNKTEGLIARCLPLTCAAILEAMILGEKRDIPAFIYNSMVKTGTVHILVVSGFNVGIVTFIITILLKILRIKRILRFFITALVLILYCLETGASNPVVRATIMAVTFMSAYFLKREPDIYNSCALAALLILIFNPRQLFDVGFQLSFASVISIISIYPKIKSILPVRAKALRFLWDAGMVSFSAWLGTAGPVAYYFRIFSPVTVLANLFIVPLASFITLLGICLVITQLIFPDLAVFMAIACEAVISLFLKVNFFLLKLPFASISLP